MDDERFMRRALTLARRGLGKTSPNPCVGAVLVRNGKIIGHYGTKEGLFSRGDFVTGLRPPLDGSSR